MKKFVLLTCIACIAVPAFANSFTHHDWQLACDNTRTCRAAGYSDDEASLAISVLLERKAGPGQQVMASVQLGTADEDRLPPASGVVTMKIDGRPLGSVQLDSNTAIGQLSEAQTEALLAALTRDSLLQWSSGEHNWTLSGKGATAVLLKMDDLQGRLGTKGALIRKGSKTDDGVLAPVPAPVVVAVPVGTVEEKLPTAERKSLLAALRGTVKSGSCEKLGDEPLSIFRLGIGKLLASTVCWRGAYNEGSGFWVVNARVPYEPALVTVTGFAYEDGSITGSSRGRGIGDCVSSDEWTWDGRRFLHTRESTTGMCRMVALGGAWELPTIVSEIRRSGAGKR